MRRQSELGDVTHHRDTLPLLDQLFSNHRNRTIGKIQNSVGHFTDNFRHAFARPTSRHFKNILGRFQESGPIRGLATYGTTFSARLRYHVWRFMSFRCKPLILSSPSLVFSLSSWQAGGLLEGLATFRQSSRPNSGA